MRTIQSIRFLEQCGIHGTRIIQRICINARGLQVIKINKIFEVVKNLNSENTFVCICLRRNEVAKRTNPKTRMLMEGSLALQQNVRDGDNS